MLTVLKDITPNELQSAVDPAKDIIFVMPNGVNCMIEREDGAFILLATERRNLLQTRPIDNQISYEFFPRLSISVPYGLSLEIREPEAVTYYTKMNIITKPVFSYRDNNLESMDPPPIGLMESIKYPHLHIGITMDYILMKRHAASGGSATNYMVEEGDPMVELKFYKNWFHRDFTQYPIVISNDEIYTNFIDNF